MLEGQKVKLRGVLDSDADLLFDWENRPELWHLGDEHSPLSKDQISAFIYNSTGDVYIDGQLRLMIDLNTPASLRAERGNLSKPEDCHSRFSFAMTVGCIDLFEYDQHNQRAGVGILIADAENRKAGNAKEALRLLTNYCFHVLDFRQLYCHIPVDNEASLKLFKSCGFEETGRCKDWVKKENEFIDAVFMQRLR